MLLDTLTDEEKRIVLEQGEVSEYAKGDLILREGEASNSLYLIVKGAVQVRKNLDDERYKQLKDLKAGDFFGDMSFLTAAARSADVLAVEDCQIIGIPRTAFDTLVEERPAIGLVVYRNIAVELASRLRRNNEELKRAIMWALDEMVS